MQLIPRSFSLSQKPSYRVKGKINLVNIMSMVGKQLLWWAFAGIAGHCTLLACSVVWVPYLLTELQCTCIATPTKADRSVFLWSVLLQRVVVFGNIMVHSPHGSQIQCGPARKLVKDFLRGFKTLGNSEACPHSIIRHQLSEFPLVLNNPGKMPQP